MAKKGKSSRYGKARSKGKRTPTNRKSANIYGTRIEDPEPTKLDYLMPGTGKLTDKMRKKYINNIPEDEISMFLKDPESVFGYQLDLKVLVKGGDASEIYDYEPALRDKILNEIETTWRRLLRPRINQLFQKNREKCDEVVKEVSENWCIVEGLERKQSTLDVPDMLGIFATKDYKKGDKLTMYPVHYMETPTFDLEKGIQSGGDHSGAFLGNLKDDERFFGEVYEKPTGQGSYINGYIYDKDAVLAADEFGQRLTEGFGPYALGFPGCGSVFGDPRPHLNQNSKYWGHYINDGVWKPGMSEEVYIAQKENYQGFNACWSGLDIIATKDIKCGEEAFLAYGEGYWFKGQNRAKRIEEGTYNECLDFLPPILGEATPKVPIKMAGVIVGGAKLTCDKEEFLLMNQTKEGYKSLLSCVEKMVENSDILD
jgi:hypothetical protein